MTGEGARLVLDRLHSASVAQQCPCAFIDGLALAVWNHPRATRDVDLLVALGGKSAHEFVDTLRPYGFRSKKTPPQLDVGNHRFVQLLFTPPDEFYDIQCDLLLAESPFEVSALERRIHCTVPGIRGTIDVVRCEDLVILKLVAGRMIDRADTAMLLRENRDTIDWNYLCRWAGELNLRRELEEAWREAFPSEALPAMG